MVCVDAGYPWVLLICLLIYVLLGLWEPVPLAFREPVPFLFMVFVAGCVLLYFSLHVARLGTISGSLFAFFLGSLFPVIVSACTVDLLVSSDLYFLSIYFLHLIKNIYIRGPPPIGCRVNILDGWL